MQKMLQLDPVIPVVTPKGKGVAVGWIDYSAEDDLLWVVFQDDTGECWVVPNKNIRAQQNITRGRSKGTPFSERPSSEKAQIINAIEYGYRCCEKGMSVGAAMDSAAGRPAC